MENWLPIQGFDGFYEVSDLGNVRSLPRRVKTAHGTRAVGARLMRPTIKKHGYAEIALARRRQYAYMLVHRIVLETFIGPPDDGHEVGHLNGIRTDNRLNNLRWVTRKENMQDQYAHGTRIAGENHPLSVLTDELVEWIRDSTQSGSAIAKELGVCISTVCRARRRDTYALSFKPEAPVGAA